MINNIETYQMFVRCDETSEKFANEFRRLFANLQPPIQESDDGDLIIAIGGDGTFLDAASSTGFDNTKIYAAVNTGTLGFLQTISPEDFSSFIESMGTKKDLFTREMHLPKITVKLDDNSEQVFYAINEVALNGIHGKKISVSEFINGHLYQNVNANTFCVASSTGDTALSLSYGGSIDFSDHFQLVRTISAGIKNAAYENFLPNPIICRHIAFVIGESNQLELLIDGNPTEFKSPISTVDVSLTGAHYINKLELVPYSKASVVRNKILGYSN